MEEELWTTVSVSREAHDAGHDAVFLAKNPDGLSGPARPPPSRLSALVTFAPDAQLSGCLRKYAATKRSVRLAAGWRRRSIPEAPN